MNIGQAATLCGLAAKTIRHYEDIGLVVPARHANNDYRDYTDINVEHLKFLQRARTLGFSLAVCGELLNIYRDSECRNAQTKALVLAKIEALDSQMYELAQLKQTLIKVANDCDNTKSYSPVVAEPLPLPASHMMQFTLVESDHE